MQKLLSVLLALLVCLPVHAQLGKLAVESAVQNKVEQAVAEKQLSQLGIEMALQQRMQRTLAQALQHYQTIGREITLGELPSVSLTNKWGVQQAGLYPNLPFLNSPDNVSNYFVARNNRFLITEIQRVQKWIDALDGKYKSMRKEAQQLEQPAKGKEIEWLVPQIPQDVTDLYIGEEHGFISIQKNMAKLLPVIRAHNPGREILVFTEFLPAGTVWTETSRAKKLPYSLRENAYIAVWNEALAQNMKVIGLEPEFAIKVSAQIKQIESTKQPVHMQEQNIWASYEGIRLRNQEWKNILQTYRQEHPEALFIVYAGAAHVLYHQLFAIPTLITSGKPFVVSFSAVCNSLEMFYPKAKFPQRAIVWKTPEFAKLAGYDAHLLVK